MSPNDKIDRLISAVGGVAEMCKVFYDSCRSQGGYRCSGHAADFTNSESFIYS